MPTYVYCCNECHRTFDRMRPCEYRNDPAPCPHCGHHGERRYVPLATNMHGAFSNDPIERYQFEHLYAD